MQYHISASILSADFSRLGEQVDQSLAAGVDAIHFDVMDNHYVPNLSFGPMVASALNKHAPKAKLDVHLMVSPTDELITKFADAGAWRISIHPEATHHLDRSISLIKERGIKAGLALNPATPLNCLDCTLDALDAILIMSVNPGFGGQKFLSQSLSKITQVASRVKKQANQIRIMVDGGVEVSNISTIADCGADTFIAGSAIFNTSNICQSVAALRHALNKC